MGSIEVLRDMNRGGCRKLIVYERMMELVTMVYEQTKTLPEDEKFGLISQMRRVVVSVISNFAEGYLKKSNKEKDLYLERSMTSLHELDTQGEICFRLSYWDKGKFDKFVRKQGEVGYVRLQTLGITLVIPGLTRNPYRQICIDPASSAG